MTGAVGLLARRASRSFVEPSWCRATATRRAVSWTSRRALRAARPAATENAASTRQPCEWWSVLNSGGSRARRRSGSAAGPARSRSSCSEEVSSTPLSLDLSPAYEDQAKQLLREAGFEDRVERHLHRRRRRSARRRVSRPKTTSPSRASSQQERSSAASSSATTRAAAVCRLGPSSAAAQAVPPLGPFRAIPGRHVFGRK